MAPMPITVTSSGASTSCGTSDSCRTKRLSEGCISRLPDKIVISIKRKPIEPSIPKLELILARLISRKTLIQPGDGLLQRTIWLDRNRLAIFGFPSRLIRGRKRRLKVNFDRQHKFAAWTHSQLQPCVSLTALSDNKHDGPGRGAETALK